MDKEIMVINKTTLFADGYFQGFASAKGLDYCQIILDNYIYEKRSTVESQPAFKQPIAYMIVVNKSSKQVFAYQRSSRDGEYNEKRLQGKWSWGIGGHIDSIDAETGDPITASMLRELSEELEIEAYDPPQVIGYINDDNTDVGRVHFGILYLIQTPAKRVKARDPEIAWGGFMSLAELEDICTADEKSVESWSEIVLEPLREILGLKNV
jgi:predicted NUDIX family phosphoesterase